MDTQVIGEMLLAYGLAGIALLAFAEKFLPLVPSSALLLLVGITTTAQPQDLLGAILASTLGSTLGAVAWYAIGRTAGSRSAQWLVRRFGRFFLLSEARYQRAVAYYGDHHFLTTVIGQLIPTARVYIAFPAGAARIAFRSFLAATVLGVFAWNSLFLVLGHLVQLRTN